MTYEDYLKKFNYYYEKLKRNEWLIKHYEALISKAETDKEKQELEKERDSKLFRLEFYETMVIKTKEEQFEIDVE